MKKQRILLWFSLFTVHCLLLTDVFAGREDVGTSGAVFLKLSAGARPAAMGEAFAGVADDVNAIFFNPAGTATLEKSEFTAQYGSWFQDIGYNALGFARPVEGVGSLGLGIVNLSVNDIERRSIDSVEPEGKFGASDYAYILHYSRAVSDEKKIYAGVNAKIISQKLDDQTAGALAADIGALWRTPFRTLSAGLVVQNLGGSVKFVNESDPLPLNIKLGFGYKWVFGEKNLLNAALDLNLPRDNDAMVGAGAEYVRKFKWDISCAARAGYKTVSQEKLGGLSGLTGGFGVRWKEFGLDFAWVPYGDLGDTYRYSLMVKF